MNNEYCIIYASTPSNPMFIVAVSRDQEMINGFREEYHYFAKYGEIVNDGKYNDFAGDYEISYLNGHYLTPIMMTGFLDYMTSIYNKFYRISEVFERNVEKIKFNTEDEEDIVYDGFSLLMEHLEVSPVEYTDLLDDYGRILNIEICLDDFINQYEPSSVL